MYFNVQQISTNFDALENKRITNRLLFKQINMRAGMLQVNSF